MILGVYRKYSFDGRSKQQAEKDAKSHEPTFKLDFQKKNKSF